ncbi:unnamed protein product [Mytilus coruscus]|uniref:Uncharacterized protein n=1 Tax=Mytilus coruscus TaxID=42192 RepID=A0A6J8DIA6_MYTCO|nr:unnamed protein product [Mytilus coruscus]
MLGNSTGNFALNATTDTYNELYNETTHTSYYDMFNGTTNTSYHDMFNGTTNTSYSVNMTITTEYGYLLTTEQPDSHKDLIWILPAFLGIVCFLFGVAFVLFYTIKYCEICILRFLYKCCGCCGPPPEKGQKTRQSYNELQEREDIADEIDAMYMKDIIESAGSFGTIDRLDDDELFAQEREKS